MIMNYRVIISHTDGSTSDYVTTQAKAYAFVLAELDHPTPGTVRAAIRSIVA